MKVGQETLILMQLKLTSSRSSVLNGETLMAIGLEMNQIRLFLMVAHLLGVIQQKIELVVEILMVTDGLTRRLIGQHTT